MAIPCLYTSKLHISKAKKCDLLSVYKIVLHWWKNYQLSASLAIGQQADAGFLILPKCLLWVILKLSFTETGR